ncbi:MAG: ACP phosphodiesterase [Sphingobacteriales bacterium JAD_PAG50586_3]|nr:MAG: ACP phosphodiesterase [Sphingobacteriales bacterium JAD_PAG50586_3]
MNYLAHLYLSNHNTGLLTGNFIADAVKGNPDGRYPADVVDGIKMHRLIDDFTDRHAATKEAVEIFRPATGRYAPVVLDIIYDHLLGINWNKVTEQDMRVFSDDVYTQLGTSYSLFPERMQLFYDKMVEYDFLPNYAEVDGLTKTLDRLQYRAKTDVDFVAAVEVMQNEKGRLSDLFLYFFTQLQAELDSKGYSRLRL